MITALATAALPVTAALLLLLALLLAGRGRKTTAQVINRLPKPLGAFFGEVGRRVLLLLGTAARKTPAREHALADRKDNRVGVLLRLTSLFYPPREKWRLEETMNHRNEQRRNGRRFSYLAAFKGACVLRWEAWTDPERRVE
ncbi:hypothetical protein [Streptomyces collinus]|uniref:hypothetical protein n=1 Tax=Streptomyces collinus TaxID=42684 RepID=UPI00332B3EAD